MKPMDLWASFGGLDPELIEQSENPKKIIPWKRYVLPLAAACLALAVLAVSPLLRGTSAETADEASFSAEVCSAEPKEGLPESNDGAIRYGGELEPECAETDAPDSPEPLPDTGLVFNDTSRLFIPYTEYEPLPYEPRSVSLSDQTARTICPWETVMDARALFDLEGGLLRTQVNIPVEGTRAVIYVSAAPNLYGADLIPNIMVDDPGEGVVSVIGSARCLAIHYNIRAAKGTAWQMKLVLRCGDTDYAMDVYAAPGEEEAVVETLEELIRRIDAEAAPDFEAIAGEGNLQ